MDGAEGVTICDIICHDDSMCALIVARGNRLEAFLTCSVPDLKFANFLVHIDSANLEVHSNRRHEIFLELIISESKEKAGFTDARVADHQHFEQVVAE